MLLALMHGAPASAAALSPLAMSCEGCHRPHGDSTVFIALDRLGAAQIAAGLQRFRDQPAAGAIMPRFAAKLSDDEIARLAAELSSSARAR